MPPKKTFSKSPFKTVPKIVNPQTTPVKKTPSEDALDKEIAQAAYYRWLSRGGGHGDDAKDWFEAEQELKGKKEKKPY